jgi:hypothetical protein
MTQMAHFNIPSKDLTTMWWDSRRPTTLHFLNQHQRLNNNCHRVLAEAGIKERKESRTRTNHDPRMNRISSIVSYELPPTTASIRHSLVPEVPPVFDMVVWRLSCVILECVNCYFVLVLVFGPSALETLRCVKPWIGSLSRMCFPSHPFMSAQVAFIKWN